jgi:hypothetical protein
VTAKAILISAVLLAAAAGLSYFVWAWATSEVLLAHGTVTSKTYVPERWSSHLTTDADGRLHSYSDYHAPEYWVSVTCPEYVFTIDRRPVFQRFREGDRVKLTYLSKLFWVKRVYAEDEEIPMEVSK